MESEKLLLDFKELCSIDFNIQNITVFEQYWFCGQSFSKLKTSPRVNHGLMIILAETTALYELNDGTSLKATLGDIVYLPKGCMYKVSFIHDKAIDANLSAAKSIIINFDIFDTQQSQIKICQRPMLITLKNNIRWVELFKKAYSYQHSAFYMPGNVKSVVYKLITNLSFQLRNVKFEYKSIENGVQLIMENWNKDISISQIANACNMCESLFRRRFKEATNISPRKYQNDIKLTKARELLVESSLSLKEISLFCGFKDEFYFSKFFKHVIGVNPSQYRKSNIIHRKN